MFHKHDEVHAVLYGNLCITFVFFWAMVWFKLFHLIVNILVEQARNINNSNGKIYILISFPWKALQLKLPETFLYFCLCFWCCVCVYVYTMRGYMYDKRFTSLGRFDICISFLQSLLIEFSENNPMSQVVLIPSCFLKKCRKLKSLF